MRPENLKHNMTTQSTKIPPKRLPSWGQPAVDEPIIDAARISLHAFGTGRSRQRTLAMYVWLRAVRPALTVAIWFVAGWYAWPHLLGASSQPDVLRMLELYAVIVSVILIFMLLIGPMRRLQHQRDRAVKDNEEPSSLFALASFINVPPARLSTWQRTKQLLVHHCPNGHLNEATDSALGKLEEPVPHRRLH